MNPSEALPANGIADCWCPSVECCDELWESAYARFETPEQEQRKFARRFTELGIPAWDRHANIADLFCGRGSGLKVLEAWGFDNLSGVDLSATLLRQYRGCARLYVGDCRNLRFESVSLDAVIIQGGLHHLPAFPDDLRSTLSEIHRVLRPHGRLVIVEPWPTPFLHGVHAIARMKLVRKFWPRLDALQVMIEREQATYDRWLSHPQEILQELTRRFRVEQMSRRWGKLNFVGRKPTEA